MQKATDAKQTSERAEAKEQAQMDIMAWITEKTANHQDASLDDSKVKVILTGKTYVKDGQPGNESFITAKGEYEIAYSELYTKTEITPAIKYGLSADGKKFIGKKSIGKRLAQTIDNCQTNNPTEDGNGYIFLEGQFHIRENWNVQLAGSDEYFNGDVYYCSSDGSSGYDYLCDFFDSNGNFLNTGGSDYDGMFYDGN